MGLPWTLVVGLALEAGGRDSAAQAGRPGRQSGFVRGTGHDPRHRGVVARLGLLVEACESVVDAPKSCRVMIGGGFAACKLCLRAAWSVVLLSLAGWPCNSVWLMTVAQQLSPVLLLWCVNNFVESVGALRSLVCCCCASRSKSKRAHVRALSSPRVVGDRYVLR